MKYLIESSGAFEKAFTAAFLMFTLFTTTDARAETWCNVSDPRDPTVNVRETPAGPVVNRLKNERAVRVDEIKTDRSGRVWARVSSSHFGEWRNWGWVFRDYLKCIDTEKLSKEVLNVRILGSVGIVLQQAQGMKMLPIGCDEVPNGWGVTVSQELYRTYRQRGFSQRAVCLGLGSNDVHFDPATGQQLKLYEAVGDISGLRPLWLPDCYKDVEIIGERGYLIGWRPTGCIPKYHPTTGLPIKDPKLVELSAGGEAGGGVDEDNRSSSVSEDRLRSLVTGR